MSHVLDIIDLACLGLPEPQTIFELSDFIQAKGEERPGPNPKYVELARRLAQRFPAC
jgi:hypothetical protein